MIAGASLISQITPEGVRGWEKVGVIGILVAGITYFIIKERYSMERLVNKISALQEELVATKREVEEARKSNELALDRAWNLHVKDVPSELGTTKNEP